MKKLDTSAVTSGNGFPIKVGTLDFLQAAYTEPIAEIMKNIIGVTYSPSTPYILSGCVATTGGGTTNITGGSIFFNGEILLSPAQSVSVVTGVLLANIGVTQYTTNADPVQFTGGGAPINVHNIRQVAYAYAATGSGSIADYSTFTRLPSEFNDSAVVSEPVDGDIFFFTLNQTRIYSTVVPTGTSTIVLRPSIGSFVGATAKLLYTQATGAGTSTVAISSFGSPIVTYLGSGDATANTARMALITYEGNIGGNNYFTVIFNS